MLTLRKGVYDFILVFSVSAWKQRKLDDLLGIFPKAFFLKTTDQYVFTMPGKSSGLKPVSGENTASIFFAALGLLIYVIDNLI